MIYSVRIVDETMFFRRGVSDKFYQILIAARLHNPRLLEKVIVEARYGRRSVWNSEGGTRIEKGVFWGEKSPEKAGRLAQKLVRQKQVKGYTFHPDGRTFLGGPAEGTVLEQVRQWERDRLAEEEERPTDEIIEAFSGEERVREVVPPSVPSTLYDAPRFVQLTGLGDDEPE